MTFWMKIVFALSLALGAMSARAQEESPPNEPPYTSAEDEFEVSTDKTEELQAGEGGEEALKEILESAPPPVREDEGGMVVEGENESGAEDPAVVEANPVPVESDPVVSTPADFEDEEPTVIERGARGTKKIRHPLAREGLMLIDRDGSYHFKPKRSKSFDQTSVLRVGAIQPPPGIVAADGTTYTGMYGAGNPVTLLYDYEWQPLQAFGRLGVQLGFGLFSSQGNGRFFCEACPLNGQPAREKYTFYALPLNAGVVYRFQFTDRPWFAPYIAGGLMYFALAELRDDDKAPNFVGTPTGYGAGGLMINLSEIDRETGFLLDSEYGIHGLWLTAEWRQIQASNPDLDFTGTILSFGVSADY